MGLIGGDADYPIAYIGRGGFCGAGELGKSAVADEATADESTPAAPVYSSRLSPVSL